MYYDILARIKNGQAARHESIQAPYSQFDFAVAQTLVDAGYIADAQKRTVGKKAMIDIKLKYRADGPAMSDFKIVSKPSRRTYASYGELRAVKQNHGVAVLSTSVGVMTNHSARKQKVGGEYLFEIW